MKQWKKSNGQGKTFEATKGTKTKATKEDKD
jgi:hypothetical protein